MAKKKNKISKKLLGGILAVVTAFVIFGCGSIDPGVGIVLEDLNSCTQLGFGSWDGGTLTCTLNPAQTYNGSVTIHDDNIHLVGNGLTIKPGNTSEYALRLTSREDSPGNFTQSSGINVSDVILDLENIPLGGSAVGLMIDGVTQSHLSFIEIKGIQDSINVAILSDWINTIPSTFITLDLIESYGGSTGLLTIGASDVTVTNSDFHNNNWGVAVIGGANFDMTMTESFITDNSHYGLIFGEGEDVQNPSTSNLVEASWSGNTICENGIGTNGVDVIMGGAITVSPDPNLPYDIVPGPFNNPGAVFDAAQEVDATNTFSTYDLGVPVGTFDLEDLGTQIECPPIPEDGVWNIQAIGGDCSQIGTQNGSTCTLEYDLVHPIQVDDPGLTLDCADHSVTTMVNNSPSIMSMHDYTVIQNCKVSSLGNFSFGINVGGDNSRIQNVEVASAYSYGILLAYAHGTLVEDATIIDGSVGISISADNTINRNITCTSDVGGCVNVATANNTLLDRIKSNDVSSRGIQLTTPSKNTQITNIEICDSGTYDMFIYDGATINPNSYNNTGDTVADIAGDAGFQFEYSCSEPPLDECTTIDGIGVNPMPQTGETVEVCNDLNGDGVNDMLSEDSPNNVVFHDLLGLYDGEWISNHSFQNSTFGFINKITNGATLGELGKNCSMLDVLTSENTASNCDNNSTTFAITHPNDVNTVTPAPVGAWSNNFAASLWYDDIVSAGVELPAGAEIDFGVDPAADGWSMGSAIHGASSGQGVAARDSLAAVEYKFTNTAFDQVICDGIVAPGGSASDCDVIEFRGNSNDKLSMEFWAATQAYPYRNSEGRGLDDEIVGVDDVNNNPICDTTLYPGCDAGELHHNADVSAELPHMFEASDTEDALAYVDVSDTGWADHATANVQIDGDTVTITINTPANMPTDDVDVPGGPDSDATELDGLPPKMGLGMVIAIGPESGINAPSYTVIGNSPLDKIDITTFGIGFVGFGQSDYCSNLDCASNATFENVQFNLLSHNANVNVREVTEEVGTLLKQGIPGAVEAAGSAVGKIGGKLDFINNLVVNAEHSDSTVHEDIKTALDTNTFLHGDYAGGGVGYFDTNDQTPFELTGINISDNVFKNVFTGIDVYGAKVKIEGNEIHIAKPEAWEQRVDDMAFELYPDYPNGLDVNLQPKGDQPNGVLSNNDPNNLAGLPPSDGTPKQYNTDRSNLGSSAQGVGLGISVACGRKNTVAELYGEVPDEVALATASDPNKGEQDTKGNRMNLLIESLDHDNCQAGVIYDNQLFANRGLGISVVGEWNGLPSSDQLACGDSTFSGISMTDECDDMDKINVLVKDNKMFAEGGAPIDEPGETNYLPHHTPGSPVLSPADGFDTCMVLVGPGLEELINSGGVETPTGMIDDPNNPGQLIQSPLYNNDNELVTVTAGLPHIYVNSNQCGNITVGSGGILNVGSMVSYIKDNAVNNSQYWSFIGVMTGNWLYETVISQYGNDVAGASFDGVYWWDGNTASSGVLKDTCTQDNFMERAVGSGWSLRCENVDAGMAVNLDSTSEVQTPGMAYIITNNVTDKIVFEVSGVEDPNIYFEDIVDLVLSNNLNDIGGNTNLVISGGGPNIEIIEDALLQNAGLGELEVRCGVRGQENRACGENTIVTLHERTCANAYNDPSDVLDNCPIMSFDNNRDSYDNSFAYYSLIAPNGDYFLVATDPDMLDPMGFAIQSSHPSINIPQNEFANIIMHVNPDGKIQGMKSKLKKGSALWVHEPTSVVWVDEVEFYPFFFESDSDWTVDVCMEVPEGYEIIEGEGCIQSFVANEEKTVLFKVEEVGSIPGNSKIKWKFRGPDGKLIKEESTVGIRLHPSLYKDKKGELEDYEIDEKGRLKKIK